MKYDIIHINGFMYAVDKEADLKPDQHWIHPKGAIFPFTDVYYKAFTALKEYGKTGVIVATNDPSLNLPLLPAVEEDNVFPCILKSNQQKGWKYWFTDKDGLNQHSDFFFDEGECRENAKRFKAASAKEFTEEDMVSFLNYYISTVPLNASSTGENNGLTKKEVLNKFIQSLRPKPVAVELEMKFTFKAVDIGAGSKVQHNTGKQPAVDENNFVKVKQWYF